MTNSFEKYIVIGTGQFAFNCAKYLNDFYQLDCVYEYGNYQQSNLQMLCKKYNFSYMKLYEKIQCDSLMYEIVKSKQKSLIISASNLYLFPEFIAENDSVKIINYHPGLFTKHLGRNAEAWSIYRQDSVTGITWHEVSTKIDQGPILAEKQIPLDRNLTSIQLMVKQYSLGFEAFKEVIKDILNNSVAFIQPIPTMAYGEMHYSYEKPHNGILDCTWEENKISAFLRSMDYGFLKTLGSPMIIENNIIYSWDSYKILDAKISIDNFKCRIIQKENLCFLLENYHEEFRQRKKVICL